MGHKVNPHGIRLGINKGWSAQWYQDKWRFWEALGSDIRARRFLNEKLKPAGVSKIYIERLARNVKITVHLAWPGVALGKGGKEIEVLRQQVSKEMGGIPVHINVEEVKKPDIDAQLVAAGIAQQITKRVSYRRLMKKAASQALRAPGNVVKGIKICVSGRLDGAEIARTEWTREGSVPLHTFRADIDYGFSEAHTSYGVVGVKVWIYKGEKLKRAEVSSEQKTKNATEEKREGAV